MASNADYKEIKDAFMVKARTLTKSDGKKYFINSWQVTDDDSDANRGGEAFIIVQPGSVPIGPMPNLRSKKIYQVNWNIVFDLQIRYTKYKTSWDLFTDLRDALLNKFVFTTDKTLTAADGTEITGIWDISITAPEPPGQKPPGGKPAWVGQRMIAIIEQQVNVI